jgi:hypothetical protein
VIANAQALGVLEVHVNVASRRNDAIRQRHSPMRPFDSNSRRVRKIA